MLNSTVTREPHGLCAQVHPADGSPIVTCAHTGSSFLPIKRGDGNEAGEDRIPVPWCLSHAYPELRVHQRPARSQWGPGHQQCQHRLGTRVQILGPRS